MTNHFGRSRRRLIRGFFIDHPAQAKFLMYTLLLLEMAALVVWVTGHWIVVYMSEKGIITSVDSLDQIQTSIHWTLFGNALAGFIVFIGVLYISRWIAGPHYRFDKILTEVSKGNLKIRTKLRKHDEFHTTADALNAALESLSHLILRERENTRNVIDDLEKIHLHIKKSKNGGRAHALKDIISKLKKRNEKIQI